MGLAFSSWHEMSQWKRWLTSKVYSFFYNSFQMGSVIWVITASPRSNECQVWWQDALRPGICLHVSANRRMLAREAFSQEETNSSTSKFWLSSAVLSVDLLWLNEERRRGINFLTSGTRGPAGLCCAACGGCNIFDVFCLPATAETACWLVTARGAIAARGCCSP